MNNTETYQPEWISEEDACKWLGVSKMSMYRYRKSLGLAFTNINGKNLMYDKKQIVKILNDNSTYQFDGTFKQKVA